MRIRTRSYMLLLLGVALASGQAFAQDGTGLGAGQDLLFTQDTPTGFGNATGGGQNSAGGSEIDAVWGAYDASGTGTLSFSVSGNLEATGGGAFNKLWLFFDGVAGGENTLLNDNVDGGFNEVQQLAGLTFDSGFTADHGLRVEAGDGFHAIRAMDLIDNTAVDVNTGGGHPGFPLVGVSGGGVTMGWDNSNIMGVDGASAAGAITATTGWEFDIDMATLFGGASQNVKIAGFISSADGTFLSNQVIGGVGGAANLGGPTNVDFNSIAGNQFVTVGVPEPGSFAVLIGGSILLFARRRRSV